MTIIRVSARGQITIPAAARKKLGIKPKSGIRLDIGEKEIIIKPIKSIADLAGILRDAKGVPGDWEAERRAAMKAVARQVEDECRP
ncbi:MAG TPA: AbrB/MazE/SpoVT family DNA-binding domain-containing protein [Armatimonadota bacterium]|nr:AbrB/MazE/SpoVT family DNA-binding domain-containing protein [Armatimonadota bacterium]